MNSQAFFKIWIVIIFIILIVGIFFTYQYWWMPQRGESLGGIPFDWRIYDGSKDVFKMGFSVMFPPNWYPTSRNPRETSKLVPDLPGFASFTAKFVYFRESTDQGVGTGGPELRFVEGATVYSEAKKRNFNPEELIEFTRQRLMAWAEANNESFEETEIVLDGQPAISFAYVIKNPYSERREKKVYIYCKTKNILISFVFDNYDSQPQKVIEYTPIVNKILSTFKFLEITIIPTQVIKEISTQLPSEIKGGSCWIESLSAPRKGAWRCSVGNVIYDPCFIVAGSENLVCDSDPITGEKGFLLKLTEPLPSTNLTNDNLGLGWGWLLELEDGISCRFMTGATSVINGKRMNYMCSDDLWVLGDLETGTVWKAEKASLERVNNEWQIYSIEWVPIRRVWQ